MEKIDSGKITKLENIGRFLDEEQTKFLAQYGNIAGYFTGKELREVILGKNAKHFVPESTEAVFDVLQMPYEGGVLTTHKPWLNETEFKGHKVIFYGKFESDMENTIKAYLLDLLKMEKEIFMRNYQKRPMPKKIRS